MSSERPLNKHPSGAEKYDQHALDENQQQKTNAKKINLRIENERYLRDHPEVSLLIKDFLKQSFLNKPDDIREYAAHYFTNPNLSEKLNGLLEENSSKNDVNKNIERMKLYE